MRKLLDKKYTPYLKEKHWKWKDLFNIIETIYDFIEKSSLIYNKNYIFDMNKRKNFNIYINFIKYIKNNLKE